MDDNQPKTANQLYRESRSELSFSEWLEQEKAKGTFIKNDFLNNVVKDALSFEQTTTPTVSNKDKILGLSKPILIISSLVVVGAIAYKIYKTKK